MISAISTRACACSRRSIRRCSATGFIVESVEEAVAAVDRLSELDRRTVRRIFDERFTASTMASNYLTLYQKLLREPDPMDTALSGVLA